jgi:hypothetical protein
VHAGQCAQKIPAAVGRSPVAGAIFELIPGPKNGPLRAGIKAFRVEQRALVVVAEERDAAILDYFIETFSRFGAVADDIAQAEDLLDALLADVGKDGLERLQIAVDVADDRPFQGQTRFGMGGAKSAEQGASSSEFMGNSLLPCPMLPARRPRWANRT